MGLVGLGWQRGLNLIFGMNYLSDLDELFFYYMLFCFCQTSVIYDTSVYYV